ncbi:MAG: glycosyltransferase family 9 protein [Endomicrobium sp.]|jgi:ADP-heptose:LPS heptosyltransferase|uniref:glycosyltransferase family 9 protein n=1 Tax=Candidatus Endomicrobiellum cubanum TaxID=3242325 RepID=UPI00282AC5A2|nr:glycosyltransferase family 9 protein [Endomicrobium sp.]
MKILIVKPSSFGDIVQALPCANALKQAYRGCQITWVVFDDWKLLPKICTDIDEVITWNRKENLKGFFDVLKKVRQTKYDIAIDLQGLLRSAILTKFSKSKIKIGVPGMKEFSNILIKEIYPQKSEINATLRNLETVHYLTGQSFDPKVNIKINANVDNIIKDNKILKNFIVFMPFARGKGKDWGILNYQKLSSLLKVKYADLNIVVLGSNNNYGKIKSSNVIDLCGKTNIDELASILVKSRVAVGADTGPMHLASVLSVPSVFIFGISDINETAPHIGKFSLLINEKKSKNIKSISPNMVFDEILKWIK